jgi:hypothetical protein
VLLYKTDRPLDTLILHPHKKKKKKVRLRKSNRCISDPSKPTHPAHPN